MDTPDVGRHQFRLGLIGGLFGASLRFAPPRRPSLAAIACGARAEGVVKLCGPWGSGERSEETQPRACIIAHPPTLPPIVRSINQSINQSASGEPPPRVRGGSAEAGRSCAWRCGHHETRRRFWSGAAGAVVTLWLATVAWGGRAYAACVERYMCLLLGAAPAASRPRPPL